MSWTFRSAAAEDWTKIATLLTNAELPLDGAQEHLQDFVLAFDEGAMLGVAGIERYGDHALLRSVAAVERGKGLGHALVHRVLDNARALGIHDVTLLTTTAADYFPRFGFRTIQRADAPLAVQASVEFQEACPTSATVMLLTL